MYGVAQYGLIEVNGDFYYCKGPDGNRKCITGRTTLNDGIGAARSQYYFDLKGKESPVSRMGHFTIREGSRRRIPQPDMKYLTYREKEKGWLIPAGKS